MRNVYSKYLLMGYREEEPMPDIPSAWLYTTRINEKGYNVRTLYHYNNTIGGDIVEVPFGHTELQKYSSYPSDLHWDYATLPFYDHQTLISVDLNNVPFLDNSMYRAFWSCINLTEVKNINKNTISLGYTFGWCRNFNQNIQIPSNVTSLEGTFEGCNKFNQNIQIHNNITNLSATFQYCYNFNQNIQIPNSVTNMAYTFEGCTNFNQNIQIPSSVTNIVDLFYGCSNFNQNVTLPTIPMWRGVFARTKYNINIKIPHGVTHIGIMFSGCNYFNQNIQIPNSVTSMSSTFYECINFNQDIQIPDVVEDMYTTFLGCVNLSQNIQMPKNLLNAAGTFVNCTSIGEESRTLKFQGANTANFFKCFDNTCANNMSSQFRVVFPLRYINGVNTVTRDSLVAAGYAVGTGLGITAANKTEKRNIRFWDWIPFLGYPTYSANGTHWILTKWTQPSDFATFTTFSPTVPNSLAIYNSTNYPTALTYSCFSANTTIWSIHLNNTAFADTTTFASAFAGCTNLYAITNFGVIPDTVTTAYRMFMNCFNLKDLVNISSTGAVSDANDSKFSSRMPNSITNAYSMYARCYNMANMCIGSYGVTTIAYAFDYCNTRDINVRLNSPDIATITNAFRGQKTTFRKNVYIYYEYANGVKTKTFNSFKPVLYTGTTGNSGTTSPMYNATSNFYIYNLGTCPI